MSLVAGLCTVFGLVVTVGEAWQEHSEGQWPEVTGQIQKCGVDLYNPSGTEYFRIDCEIGYSVGDTEITTEVYSRTIPSPQRMIWQYPTGQIGTMQDWVDQHPRGTPIVVHYDPANRRNAVLVATDMPLGGPRTPSNMKLLEAVAASFVILLTIAQIIRPRSAVIAS